MATKVHMEALSPTMEEGQLVRWLMNEGDTVKEGDVLAEIETDKATMELVARGSGVLQSITLAAGGTAPVGQVIAIIGDAGSAPAAKAEAPAAPPAITEAPAKAEAPAPTDAPAKAEAAPADAPVQAEAVESGALDAETAGGPAAAATPKAADADVPAKSEAAQDSTGIAPPKPGAPDGRLRASPLARRLAEDAGVDLAGVSGTGPGGRITKRDIEAASSSKGEGAPAAKTETSSQPAAAATPAAAPTVAPRAADGPDSESVPVTQMRKSIAKRLAMSIGPIPTFYLTIECDMTRMNELRDRANKMLEKEGVKASVNDFLIKAIASALARHPEVNASWSDAAITRHHRVHIGVAVAVEDGLITPIVRDADRKRVRDIAGEVKELAARAREKKLKPEEYTGATFTISNLGMFGIVEFTAIINPPEAGIIAVGASEEKVVVVDGEMVVRSRMRITMSCDHRVVDGVTGAKFLQTVKSYIEDPLNMIV